MAAEMERRRAAAAAAAEAQAAIIAEEKRRIEEAAAAERAAAEAAEAERVKKEAAEAEAAAAKARADAEAEAARASAEAADAERREHERQELEAAEALRTAAVAAEQERIAAVAADAYRRAAEATAVQRRAAEEAEAERQAARAAAAAQWEKEKAEDDRASAAAADAGRAAEEAAEAERAAAAAAEAEREAAAAAHAERDEAEAAEAKRAASAQAETDRLTSEAAKAEREAIEALRAQREAEAAAKKKRLAAQAEAAVEARRRAQEAEVARRKEAAAELEKRRAAVAAEAERQAKAAAEARRFAVAKEEAELARRAADAERLAAESAAAEQSLTGTTAAGRAASETAQAEATEVVPSMEERRAFLAASMERLRQEAAEKKRPRDGQAPSVTSDREAEKAEADRISVGTSKAAEAGDKEQFEDKELTAEEVLVAEEAEEARLIAEAAVAARIASEAERLAAEDLEVAAAAARSASDVAEPEVLDQAAMPATAAAAAGAVTLNIGGMPITIPGKLLLFVVAGLWGSFSPLVRVLYAQEHAPSPEMFNAQRLALSTVAFLPVFWGEWVRAREADAAALKAEGAKEAMQATEAQVVPKSPIEVDEAKDGVDSSATKSVDHVAVDDATEDIREDDSVASKPKEAEVLPDERPGSVAAAGLELGVWVFLANVSQVLGLDATSASQAAFLNQLQTVVVPVLAAVTGVQAVSGCSWAASGIALSGVALLSLDKSNEALSTLNGDGLEVLSALFFSIYILRLGQMAKRHRAAPLVGVKVFAQAVLSAAWVASTAMLAPAVDDVAASYAPGGRIVPTVGVLGSEWLFGEVAVTAAVVAWTGLVVSALAGYLQARGQAAVKPSDAAIIFASQPLFAAALSALTLGEGFGPDAIAGGFLILSATAVSSAEGQIGGGATTAGEADRSKAVDVQSSNPTDDESESEKSNK